MAKHTKQEARDADAVIREYVEGEITGKEQEQTDVEQEFESAGEKTATGRDRFPQMRRRDQQVSSTELTGGDLDAARDPAGTTGEEMVGGSNPTPDQDLVDEIGKGAGVTYADDEPLKFGDKVGDRDTNRWELDPASSEDYEDRQRDEPPQKGNSTK
ncbi:MAG TPA: DUF6335 family protein [Nitrospiraceae bacterium]|nr:DUF6335 family protein [Nitrospiraceae bacterium]